MDIKDLDYDTYKAAMKKLLKNSKKERVVKVEYSYFRALYAAYPKNWRPYSLDGTVIPSFKIKDNSYLFLVPRDDFEYFKDFIEKMPLRDPKEKEILARNMDSLMKDLFAFGA